MPHVVHDVPACETLDMAFNVRANISSSPCIDTDHLDTPLTKLSKIDLDITARETFEFSQLGENKLWSIRLCTDKMMMMMTTMIMINLS